MNLKRPLTIILLVFVAASVVSMVLNEIRRQPANATAGRVQTSAGDVTPKLIAYYLHGKIRCVTCNDIERSAKEAIKEGFGPELESGRLEWRVVNYEEPGNERYATDFKLAAPCVVLASVHDGRQVAWKSLPEIWELVGDKPAFRKFVQERVQERLQQTEQANPSPLTTSTPAVVASAAEITWTTKLPRLLDLGAGKCVPCKMMAPILEELKKENKGRLDVVFIDVWEDSAPAEKYDVSTIPTQIFFDTEGREVFRHEGFFSKEEILAKWKEFGVDL